VQHACSSVIIPFLASQLVNPQQQQVHLGTGLQQSQSPEQQPQASSGSVRQHEVQRGPQTPRPLQHVQQACVAETVPFFTSSVVTPQQQHEHMRTGGLVGHRLNERHRPAMMMHSKGIANRGAAKAKNTINTIMNTLTTLQQKNPLGNFMPPMRSST
jgi:hypothetical protein